MLFSEYDDPIQLWRLMPAIDDSTDPAWTFITTISGRFEPISPVETIQNDQNHADVSELLFLPYTYHNAVAAGDGVVDIEGIQRKIVGQPEDWKHMLPVVVCKVARAQWTVVS